MPTTQLLPVPRMQFFDSNGDPLAGGFLYAYAAGTSTPQNTYADESGTVPNSNPVTLDSGGFAEVWLDASLQYKFVLTDSNGGQIWTVDNVYSIIPGTALTSLAQTWTALQTFQDLAIKGPFPPTWPSSATNQLLIAGTDNTHSLGTNVIGRIYCGDGTGWFLGIAKRVGGNDTDQFKFNDNGTLLIGCESPSSAINLAINNSSGFTPSDVRMAVSAPGRLEIDLGDNSDSGDLLWRNAYINGVVKHINGMDTVGPGVPAIGASVDLVGQSSAISTTNLIASAKQGTYILSYYLETTTTGNAVNLSAQFTWFDENGSRLQTNSIIDCSGLNSTSGQTVIYQVSGMVGNPIGYATTLSGAIGTGRYSLHVRLVYLG